MPNHPYKQEEEKRIAATYSIREVQVRSLRTVLSEQLGHIPTRHECEVALRIIARLGMDSFLESPRPISEEVTELVSKRPKTP